MTDGSAIRDQEDLLARIRRSDAETEEFMEEAFTLRPEEAKSRAEGRKLGRDTWAFPVVSAMTAGAPARARGC